MNPYYISDPKIKKLRQLMDEITLLGKGLGEENEEHIQISLESMCKAFGVEDVICIQCGNTIPYVFTSMMEDTYICLRCWHANKRKALENAKIRWLEIINTPLPSFDINEEVNNDTTIEEQGTKEDTI